MSLLFLQIVITTLKKPVDLRREEDIANILPIMSDIEFFKKNQDIKEKDLVDICTRVKYLRTSAGEKVFNHGEYGDKFYIILRGTLKVLIPIKKPEKIVSSRSLLDKSKTSRDSSLDASSKIDNSSVESPDNNFND